MMFLYFEKKKKTNMDTIKICKPITVPLSKLKLYYTSLKFLKSIKFNEPFIH